MGRRKKWDVELFDGQTAAGILLAALFLLGSVAGCVAAGTIRDPAGELLDYVRYYVTLAAGDGFSPRVLALLWRTVRIPLLVIMLGVTALGVAGIPLLFVLKGFALCYAVSVFYRLLGLSGLLLGGVLFGLSALVWLPVLFGLGERGLPGAYGLLRRATGDGRYPLGYNGGTLICCGICAAALCLCVGIEYFVVPMLLQKIAGILLTG